MFFLFDMFKDQNALNPIGNNIITTALQVASGIFNHVDILNNISTSTNVWDTTIPTEWTRETVLSPNFANTLDGGSLSQIIADIDYFEVQRKERNSDTWITIQKIGKDAQGTLHTSFSLKDNLAANNRLYDYQILPFDANGNPGTALQQSVLSIFSGAYIADATHAYKICLEYEIGSAQKNQVSTLYTPYGAKMPFVGYNALTQYDSGTITAVLLAPTSASGERAFLDRYAQTRLVEEFNSWLANGKAKILKDFNGFYKIVAVIDPVANTYYKELGNGLASTSFNYVQVGEFTQEYLDKLGLTNKYDVQYK